MKILFDAHMVGEKETGNESYAVGLLRGLVSLDTDATFIVAAAHPDALARKVTLDARFHVVPVSAGAFRRLLWDLPRIAAEENVDLIHCSYAAPITTIATAVTVHDICFRHHPEWFSLRDRVVLNLGVSTSVRRAKAVITVSEFTRRELLREWRLDPLRMHVTLEAGHDAYRAAVPAEQSLLARYGIRTPYVVAVGNLQPRKNLERLLKAFAAIRRRGFPHQLVIVGMVRWQGSAVIAAARQGMEESSVCFTGYVPDSDLPSLVAGADLLAFPSLYEGFGLPVLEAMAAGVPVVVSNATALPEVAGEAAEYVDPASVDSIAQGMGAVLANPARRQDLARRGRERAACFSWRRTAELTLDVYAGALGKVRAEHTAAG